MKGPAEDPPGGEEKGERIRSYTVQLWPSDMQFLEDLAAERNESAGELRRRAMRIGKLIIATETPPMKDGKYGKQYTPVELAKELADSVVVQALQFTERQGVSLVTVPKAFFDGLTQAISSGFADALARTGGIHLSAQAKEETQQREEQDAEQTKPSLIRAATLRRQGFKNDIKV